MTKEVKIDKVLDVKPGMSEAYGNDHEHIKNHGKGAGSSCVSK